jgi:hypothetical protein
MARREELLEEWNVARQQQSLKRIARWNDE